MNSVRIRLFLAWTVFLSGYMSILVSIYNAAISTPGISLAWGLLFLFGLLLFYSGGYMILQYIQTGQIGYKVTHINK